MDHEKARKPGGPAGRENEMDGTPSLPCRAQAVNTGNPRLWRALRKFDRNLKRIIRLREKNAVLLEEMRRLQAVTS
jgi:hypothetical protein